MRRRLVASTALWLATSCRLIEPYRPPPPTEPEAEVPPPAYVAHNPLHRLNAIEFDNTVRDLLGTTLQPGRDFPPDSASGGFDNNAAALSITPTWFAAAVRAAEQVVDEALWVGSVYERAYLGEALVTEEGYPLGELWALSGEPLTLTIEVPEDGDYELAFVAGGVQTGDAVAPLLDVSIDGEVRFGDVAIEGTPAAPGRHLFWVTLTAGEHTVTLDPTNFQNWAPANRHNDVAIEEVVVRSGQAAYGPGYARVFHCDPDPVERPECATEVIVRFAQRAWRRPLAVEERAALLLLHDTVLRDGESPVDAVRLVIRHILASPKFLFRTPSLDPAWTDFELATRLSYFIWGTTPDDELLAKADAGDLSTLQGRRETVVAMLADPRSRALLDGFAEQWLGVRAMKQAAPSPELFPGFTDEVRSAMADEARSLFGDFLANGAPVDRLLDPGFSYLDDDLALHYGLPPVGSLDVQRTPVARDQRQGLLTLGSWLVAKSDAEHGSPIRRGRWVSENVLCVDIPPPPADLEIPEFEIGVGELTVREQLERHRDDVACAACHELLDVVGIGFEGFDASGAPVPGEVDDLGELPGGPTFEGAAGLTDIVDRRRFAQCVRKKLFTYAMGRIPDEVDKHWLDHAPIADSTLPDLILQITTSPLFHDPPEGGE